MSRASPPRYAFRGLDEAGRPVRAPIDAESAAAALEKARASVHRVTMLYRLMDEPEPWYMPLIAAAEADVRTLTWRRRVPSGFASIEDRIRAGELKGRIGWFRTSADVDSLLDAMMKRLPMAMFASFLRDWRPPAADDVSRWMRTTEAGAGQVTRQRPGRGEPEDPDWYRDWIEKQLRKGREQRFPEFELQRLHRRREAWEGTSAGLPLLPVLDRGIEGTHPPVPDRAVFALSVVLPSLLAPGSPPPGHANLDWVEKESGNWSPVPKLSLLILLQAAKDGADAVRLRPLEDRCALEYGIAGTCQESISPPRRMSLEVVPLLAAAAGISPRLLPPQRNVLDLGRPKPVVRIESHLWMGEYGESLELRFRRP